MGESGPRKKFEADILKDWIEKQKAQRQAPRPLKGRMPRVTPMQSSRQRRALRQTPDAVRAAYSPEHQANATPVRPSTEGLTREVGPNDKHNDRNYRTGKATANRFPERSQKRKPTRQAPQSEPRIKADGSLSALEAFIANKGRL